MPSAKASAEKKIVVERAEAECCEASFYWKNKAGCGEHKLAKKQILTWKNRILLFQNPAWKSKAERSKASPCCLQV
jgi:hypothetical protein